MLCLRPLVVSGVVALVSMHSLPVRAQVADGVPARDVLPVAAEDSNPPPSREPTNSSDAASPDEAEITAVPAATPPAPGDDLAPPKEVAPSPADPRAVVDGASARATQPSQVPAASPSEAARTAELPEDKLSALSVRSTATQREIEALLRKRDRIRLTGLNYARYVTWSAATAFGVASLLSFGTAQDVERDVRSGDYVGASDRDSDGDVDGDDERHARRISRTMGGASLVMVAGGVLSSVFYRLQLREMDALTNEIEGLRSRQKRTIFELDYELKASRTGARLGLIVRM